MFMKFNVCLRYMMVFSVNMSVSTFNLNRHSTLYHRHHLHIIIMNNDECITHIII